MAHSHFFRPADGFHRAGRHLGQCTVPAAAQRRRPYGPAGRQGHRAGWLAAGGSRPVAFHLHRRGGSLVSHPLRHQYGSAAGGRTADRPCPLGRAVRAGCYTRRNDGAGIRLPPQPPDMADVLGLLRPGLPFPHPDPAHHPDGFCDDGGGGAGPLPLQAPAGAGVFSALPCHHERVGADGLFLPGHPERPASTRSPLFLRLHGAGLGAAGCGVAGHGAAPLRAGASRAHRGLCRFLPAGHERLFPTAVRDTGDRYVLLPLSPDGRCEGGL